MIKFISCRIQVKMKFLVKFLEKLRRRGPVIRFTGKHNISIHILSPLSICTGSFSLKRNSATVFFRSAAPVLRFPRGL